MRDEIECIITIKVVETCNERAGLPWKRLLDFRWVYAWKFDH